MKKTLLGKIVWAASILLLAALLVNINIDYSANPDGDFRLEDYLKQPAKYSGYREERFGRIAEINDSYFYLDIGQRQIRVEGSGVKKAVLGETAVLVEYGKDGTIKMLGYHNYNYNHVLYFTSILALGIFAVLFFKEWKLTKRGFKNA